MAPALESVVTFKWRPHEGYRSQYGPGTVNTLRNMVRRNYQQPHRFICVTDDPAGIDKDIEIVPLWDDFKDLQSPHGGGYKNPSCYRRLRIFHPEIATILGRRFVSIDLDTVIVGDLTRLWERPEDFVAWGDTHPRTYYNGSMIMLTAGSRPQVWNDFDPKKSPRVAKSAGHWGSDQGWISYCLGPKEAKWTKDDGVYSFRNHLRRTKDLPSGARVVCFHGSHDPWDSWVQSEWPWVPEHYH